MVFAAAVSLGLAASAQTRVFDFTTAIGNGSFTLDLNVLTMATNTSNYTVYNDPVDVLTFNGTNYDSLTFTVINDINLVRQNIDGFFVQAGSNGTTTPPYLSIVAVVNGSIINGTSVSDLVTVLSSYDTFYPGNDVHPPSHIVFQYDSLSPSITGDLYSFQLVPEPSTATLFFLGATGTFIWHYRGFLKKSSNLRCK